jgi:tRNA dimethylallyltransferase
MEKRPLMAIVGPTASGKSELAVQIAQQFSGEIISADSRQVYRGMDLGTGKVEGTWEKVGGTKRFVYKSIVHHGIDIASPKRQFSVSRFQNYCEDILPGIYRRQHLPILCGGTGHWIDAVVYNQHLPHVPPQPELRKKLERIATTELFNQLKQLDPDRAANIDQHNPRRLIRALEIVITTGSPVPQTTTQESPYDVLWLGLKPNPETLQQKITTRLDERLKVGLIDEVKQLRANHISWQRLESFGLEYSFVARHLQGQLSFDEMRSGLITTINQYAKRQLTWWKKNPDIHWFSTADEALEFINKKGFPEI